MEDDWSILPSAMPSIPVQVKKRVLNNQIFKIQANPSTPNKSLNDIEHIPITPKKTIDISDASTQHSKKSLIYQRNQKSTPEKAKSPIKSSTPSKSPVKQVDHTNSIQEKRVFNQSLSNFKQEFPTNSSISKHETRKSGSSLMSGRESLLRSSIQTKSSAFHREPGEKPKNTYDAKLQRQKIFNQSFEIGERVEKTIIPEKPKAKGRITTSFLNQLPSPSEMKLQELSTLVITPAPNQVEVFDISVECVPVNYSEDCFKDLLTGFHVVFMQLDLDNLTGFCRGTGKLKLRTNYESDISSLLARLRKHGISGRVEKDYKGKRNDFSDFFTENWNSPRKTQISPSKAREAKLRSLESSIFSG